MKTIIIIYISLFFSACTSAQESSDIIDIVQTIRNGDRVNSTLIGVSNESLLKAEINLKLERQSPFTKKYIVSKESLAIIKDFVYKNCDPIDHRTETTVNLFTIKTITKDGVKICYIKEDILLPGI